MPETEEAGWTQDLPVGGRAAQNLEDEYDSEAELIEAYREAEDISDVPQVGRVTMRDLREHIHEQDPEAEQVRKENDVAICTEFTTDHGLEDPDPDMFNFAFICPRCEARNPCKGDPEGFGGRPYLCTECNWVPSLDGESASDFAEEVEA